MGVRTAVLMFIAIEDCNTNAKSCANHAFKRKMPVSNLKLLTGKID